MVLHLITQQFYNGSRICKFWARNKFLALSTTQSWPWVEIEVPPDSVITCPD